MATAKKFVAYFEPEHKHIMHVNKIFTKHFPKKFNIFQDEDGIEVYAKKLVDVEIMKNFVQEMLTD